MIGISGVSRRASPERWEGQTDCRSRIGYTALRRYLYISIAIAGAGFIAAIVVSLLAVAHANSSAGQSRFNEVSAAAADSQVSSTFIEVSNTRWVAPYIARGRIHNVNITFYDCAVQGFCGAMYNGRQVYEGAAACSWNMAIGTRFVIVGDPTGRIYVCEDRGLLANTWVDIFFYYPADGYDWQGFVGRYGSIEIVTLASHQERSGAR